VTVMDKIFARRIWSLRDVNFIANGIAYGIHDNVFSDLTLMETLRMISGKDITFYIFLTPYKADGKDVSVPIGFGAIRNDREVYKVFVVPQARRRGFGTRISLWLKKVILKHGYIPICFIKITNVKWSETMSKQGMTKVDIGYGGTDRYMLTDFEKYVNAVKKHKIMEIQYIKKKVK